MAKLPSFQFYPGDWRKDPNLSRATLAAKGAMIEIMCIAFECEKRGVLKTGGKPWTIDEISMAIGGNFKTNKKAILELIDKKILKKDKKNTIFNARMVRDSDIIKKRSDGGKLGAEHGFKGKVFGKLGGRPVKKPPLEPPLEPPPSSSSSSSEKNSSDAIFSKPPLHIEQIFEFLRMATDRQFISDWQIHKEAEEFIKKYNGTNIKNLRSLCNTWANNIIPEKEKQVVI